MLPHPTLTLGATFLSNDTTAVPVTGFAGSLIRRASLRLNVLPLGTRASALTSLPLYSITPGLT